MDDNDRPANVIDDDLTRNLPPFNFSLLPQSLPDPESGSSTWPAWPDSSFGTAPATPTIAIPPLRQFLASGTPGLSGSESPQSGSSSDAENITHRTRSLALHTPLHQQVGHHLLATQSSSDSEISPRTVLVNNRIAVLRSSSDSESQSGTSTSRSSTLTALTSARSHSPRSSRKRNELITEAEKSLSFV